MNYLFNTLFLEENEILFYSYVAIIIIMIVLTILFVKKELGKKK